jgi:hypothetical protein
MAIALDTTGSTATTAGGTAATVDITAAATGAWAYLFISMPAATTTPSNASWTQLAAVTDSVLTVQYAICRRQKQAGDTTFSFTWSGAAKGVLAWASYTGLDGTTPDEGAAVTFNGTTSATAVPTPSATPSATGRWALAFFAARTSTSGNKNITWTPDAATTERLDANNSAAASAAWTGVEIADTNTTVAASSQSYTATHAPAAEAHDGSGILFLIPPTGGPVNVNAGQAAGTGAAPPPAAAAAVTAPPVTCTGGAPAAVAGPGARPGIPAVPGTAAQPAVPGTVAASAPAGAAQAPAPVPAAADRAGIPSATGTAPAAQVQAGLAITAPPAAAPATATPPRTAVTVLPATPAAAAAAPAAASQLPAGTDITVTIGPTTWRALAAPGTIQGDGAAAGNTASRAQSGTAGNVQGDGAAAGATQGDGAAAGNTAGDGTAIGATTVDRRA